MTPFEIGILLHYYTTPVAHPQEADPSRIWPDTIKTFVDLKLIEPNPTSPPPDLAYTPSVYKIAERGRAYVERGLLKVPLPERVWIIPEVSDD